jgi:serine/threonine protein kinase
MGLGSCSKWHAGEYPSASELAQLRHEYALLQHLAGAPVPQPIDIMPCGHGLAMVLCDAGRTSLASLLQQGPLELGDFLRYARLAAEALEQVHARGVLHKDIKPEHFVLSDSSDTHGQPQSP